jgi:hypothetical protein
LNIQSKLTEILKTNPPPYAIGLWQEIHTKPVDPISTLSEEEKELFDERAGILEFDGGFSREEAERMALKCLEGIKKAFD